MDTYGFLDTLVRVHVRGEDTGGRYGLVECLEPPGHQPPPHVHHDDDEGFFVLEGEITVYAGDDETVLGPGDGLNAPRGVPHTFRVTSPELARVLVTSAPARFDAFVASSASPPRATSCPSSTARRTSSASSGPPPATASRSSARPGPFRPTSGPESRRRQRPRDARTASRPAPSPSAASGAGA